MCDISPAHTYSTIFLPMLTTNDNEDKKYHCNVLMEKYMYDQIFYPNSLSPNLAGL